MNPTVKMLWKCKLRQEKQFIKICQKKYLSQKCLQILDKRCRDLISFFFFFSPNEETKPCWIAQLKIMTGWEFMIISFHMKSHGYVRKTFLFFLMEMDKKKNLFREGRLKNRLGRWTVKKTCFSAAIGAIYDSLYTQ